jgi:hypothetical protein
MHFRLPKPLHGWREFAGEVGIIVMGVLIALGAEQVVETMHAHGEAAAAEQRIRQELADDSALEVERIAVGPCLTQRIGRIAQQLASGTTDWSGMLFPLTPERPMAMREIYHMPSRNWVTDAYREALARGDLNSLDPARRSQLAALYNQIAMLSDRNDTEQQLATTLAPLQFNRPLSDTERNQMIATLGRLDTINGLVILVSRQNLEGVHDLGFAVDRSQLFRDIGTAKNWDEELDGLRKRYGNCVDASAIIQYENIAIRGAKTA